MKLWHVRRLKCYHPIWRRCDRSVLSYGTFWLCTLCASVTLTFDLFSPKLGHVSRRAWIYVPIWKLVLEVFVFETQEHRFQI